ncbi:MAG: FkbM family methyltransferase [Methylococcales bacterium]|nr:FkbM family methyltransferase [Methylococcales bacterium]
MSKSVFLNTTLGKQVVLTGGDNDKSIIGAIASSKGYYETHIMSALPEIIADDFVCLDVGANIGALSLAFAGLAVNGKVFSIEAGRTNFEFLKNNIQINYFNNVTPIYVAVSDYIGTATFNYVEEVAGCSFISTNGIGMGVQETVKVTTIDALIQELGLDRLDFIKMDVEGGEKKALLGAMQTLERFRPVLLIEWNPQTIKRFYDEDPAELFALLSSVWSSIVLLRDNETIVIENYDHLSQITADGKGWEDLLCKP